MKTLGPTSAPRRALLVEDDEGVRRSMQLMLTWRGYEVRSYAAAGPVLASEDFDDPAVLIADYRLPDATGTDLLRTLRSRGWRGRAVLITGCLAAEIAGSEQFDAVLHKPLRQTDLLAALAA